MDWHKRSTVEGMKTLLEGLYEPDRSSSLLISRSGDLDFESDVYSDFFFKLFPQTSGGVFTIIDGEKRLFVALREAISEMSLPGYVRVEAIDDNSWNLGRLHGMRRVRYEKSVSERFMVALQNAAYRIVLAGIQIFINLHWFVAAFALVVAALTQEIVLVAAVMGVVIPPVIKENKNWRSLQKQRLARLAHQKEEWRESELDYRKRLRERCADPVRWNLTKIYVYSRISKSLLGNLVDRYYKWNASRRASIRLAMMSANDAPS